MSRKGLHLVKVIILDINGVLYESGRTTPIEGSVEALESLASKFRICLVTNQCTTPKRLLAQRLNELGFKSVCEEQIISPAPLACEFIIKNNLRPLFLVWPDILEDFEPVFAHRRSLVSQQGLTAGDKTSKAQLETASAETYLNTRKAEDIQNEQTQAKVATESRERREKEEEYEDEMEPDCLVVGNLKTSATRDRLDATLEKMLASPAAATSNLRIVSLGAGRYYRDAGKLRLGTGSYAAAFEFALQTRAHNVGKPSAAMFEAAMRQTNARTPGECLMIGDDIVSDVGGAQQCGMLAALVRTGKWAPSDESRQPNIKPDAIFGDLREATRALMNL